MAFILGFPATLELGALATADNALLRSGVGNAAVVNDVNWMNRRDRIACGRARSGSPMDVDSTGSSRRRDDRRRDDGRSKPMQGLEYGSARGSQSSRRR